MTSTFNIALGSASPRDKKKIQVPQGWTEGFPSRLDTGNYYLNGSEKMVYFWNGKEWNRATKDIFGELTWHTRLEKQPKTKYFKLIKHLALL